MDEYTVSMVLEAAGRLLDDNSYGFLGTGDGDIALRLVHHLRRDALDTIWIGTSPRSRKAVDVERTSRATYAVEDRTRFAYVSLHCAAFVDVHPRRLEELWMPSLETFFPAGPLSGDFALICLEPHRLELMSFADRIHPDPYGLRAAVATRAGASWRV